MPTRVQSRLLWRLLKFSWTPRFQTRPYCCHAPRRPGHRQFHLQDLLLTRWHRFFFRRAALCRTRCPLRSVAAPPHDSAPSWSMVVGLPPSCGNSTPSHELVLSHLAIVTSIAGRAHRDGARRTGPAGTWQPRKRRSARVSGRTSMFRHFGLAR